MSPTPTSGRFITLEGGEGAGKSTLARGLAEALRGQGHEVVLTREPGGAPGADAIRALLVQGEAGRWDAMEEALLFAAARRNHLSHTIRPALARGAWVICDRYYDSTRAYQVAAGGLDPRALDTLTALIEAPAPDLTFVLDFAPEAGLARSQGRHVGEDRFEKKTADFHARVRAEFLAIAEREPHRCVVIDASQSGADVLAQARAALEARL
ncbi:MAG TPA: dTMP kinase [Vitreimonas sp.]|uniref:dTMP kinase n=1 Tax=Vitreimonas sp. TaxID=3069702 RepID=UPI002D597BFA|nr:dTMP kinase [Vitreimonas sp.]HYD87450.1 dTMP kinase [Vitreimonas sp.]